MLPVLILSLTIAGQIAQQFDTHPVVMFGELHRWQELHGFVEQLVRDADFICRADDVVVEFGNSRFQKVADRYASGGKVSEAELQAMWRETAVPLTWNSPLYRRFYETVRDVNRRHLCAHPLRLVLGDGPIDWSKIHTARDLEPWTDRDGEIAKVIEREVIARRHRAFVLSGLAHVLRRGLPGGAAAAELIERKHPGAVFSIAPVRTAADAEAMHLGAPPAFRLVHGSELQNADFRLIWKDDPDAPWPPMGEVIDGVLYIGSEQTLLYPPPSIYLEPSYLKELRRRAALIKEVTGQDFPGTIDGLVKEARRK